MLIFEQLRISDDAKQMYLDFRISEADYYDDVTLDSLTIIPAWSRTGDIQVLEAHGIPPTDGYIYKKEYTNDERGDHLVLDKAALDEAFNNTDSHGEPIHEGPTAKAELNGTDFSKGLYFVYVKCKIPVDKLNPCVPCDSDYAMTEIGVTFYEKMLYQTIMGYTKELGNSCEIPRDFVDFILLWNAFKAAVNTGHFLEAVKLWQEMFGNIQKFPTIGGRPNCRCHG